MQVRSVNQIVSSPLDAAHGVDELAHTDLKRHERQDAWLLAVTVVPWLVKWCGPLGERCEAAYLIGSLGGLR